MGNISATTKLADLDNVGMVLGVIEDAEFISDIFKIRNGSLNQNWPNFNHISTPSRSIFINF